MKKTPAQLVNLMFSIVIILLTASGAIAFLFTDFMMDALFGWRRYALTTIFIFYTIYRLIRIKGIIMS